MHALIYLSVEYNRSRGNVLNLNDETQGNVLNLNDETQGNKETQAFSTEN